MFPHHECELAQNTASRGKGGVRYWVHNNMITINGKKMGKSLSNFITLQELFEGTHDILEQAYSPMTIRFFILQAHYRSTLDFSNEALQAAEKGLKKIMQAAKDLKTMAQGAGVDTSRKGTAGHNAEEMAYGEFLAETAPETCVADSVEIKTLFENIYTALCDDLNTPVALSHIFDAVRMINSAKEKSLKLTVNDLTALMQIFGDIVFGVMGLRDEETGSGKASKTIGCLMDMVIEQRKAAKAAKDWATSDRIRDDLKAAGIILKDTRDGVEWTLE